MGSIQLSSSRVSLTGNLRKRVFVLGPSHHVYLDGCALSKCKTYATPIGDLPLDLKSRPCFSQGFAMELRSMRIQPSPSCVTRGSSATWIYRPTKTSTALKCTYLTCVRCSKGEDAIPRAPPLVDRPARLDISIVPILIGAIGREAEARFGKVIAPFLAREDTFCVVSSDFCHW